MVCRGLFLFVYESGNAGKISCMRVMIRAGVALLLAFGVAGGLAADKPDVELYQREVKPLLQARCVACHGALKSKGGLRLDTADLLRKGGGNGAVIDPSSRGGRWEVWP